MEKMKVNIEEYAEILLTTKCPCCGKKLAMKIYQKMYAGDTKRCYGPHNIKSTIVEDEK